MLSHCNYCKKSVLDRHGKASTDEARTGQVVEMTGKPSPVSEAVLDSGPGDFFKRNQHIASGPEVLANIYINIYGRVCIQTHDPYMKGFFKDGECR
jgi:hypothetical protein